MDVKNCLISLLQSDMHGTLTFVLIPSQQIKPPPAKETVVSDVFFVHCLLSDGYFELLFLN